jgi:hypothetical protein
MTKVGVKTYSTSDRRFAEDILGSFIQQVEKTLVEYKKNRGI